VTDTTADKVTEEWLLAQKETTRRTYKSYWKYFLRFTGLTGDQILESRKADREYAWEKKVLELKGWLIKEGLSETSASVATAVVRGFFAYHRVTLEFRRSESAKLAEAKSKYEDYRFSLEDLKKMYDVSDLEERYIITAGKSFGLRAGDFLKLTRGDLEAYLDRSVPIGIGAYATQKEGVNAYPFIDSDALPVIKLMIEKMDREGRREPTDRILTFKKGIQQTRVIQRVVKQAGINIGNKRVRFHCLRKFLIDRLSSFMSESKWKQIVGKAISEGAYVSPDSLRDDYARAMNETCFSKLAPQNDMEKISKKQAVLAIAGTIGITERDITSMFRRRTFKPRNLDEEIKLIEEIIKARRKEGENPNNSENDCPDGEHCERFEQIKEGELLTYLRNGWQIVHRLAKDEVIVKR